MCFLGEGEASCFLLNFYISNGYIDFKKDIRGFNEDVIRAFLGGFVSNREEG